MGGTLSSNGKAAVAYAQRFKLRVFPVYEMAEGACSCGKPNCPNPGKHPRCEHGCNDATSDEKQIRAWWTDWPKANIGIATGNGLLVLDIDPRHGGDESLVQLKADYGQLPDTPCVITGGGGRHFYFTGDGPTRAGVYPGVDLRGRGGYVVAPPSNHASGRKYVWEASSRIDENPMAAAPAWMVMQRTRQSDQDGTAGKPRLDPASILSGVKEGERHTKLVAYAGKMRHEGRDREEARVLLDAAMRNAKPPYTEESAEQIVDDIWKRYPVRDAKAPRAAQAVVEWLSLEDPIITTEGNALQAEWTPPGIVANVDLIRVESSGDVTGLLTIAGSMPGVPTSILSYSRMNFASAQTRSTQAKICAKRTQRDPDDPLWSNLFERLSAEVIRFALQGSPVSPERDFEQGEPPPPEYVLYPVLLAGEQTILYGDKGTGKSYLATLLTYFLTVGESRGFDRLEVRRPSHALMLDWEGTEISLNRRWYRLHRGCGLELRRDVGYRRCSLPLAHDIGQIRKMIRAGLYDFLLIDSLGLAAGGDLNSPQSAMEFFSALRSLDVTALVIAHPAKNAIAGGSVFGSQFFSTAPRSIWTVEKDQDEGADLSRVGVYHRKANEGRLEAPLAFCFEFGGDYTRVTQENPQSVLSGEDRLSLPDRIINLLRTDNVLLTYAQIAKALNVDEGVVRAAVARLMRSDKVTKVRKDVRSGKVQIALSAPDDQAAYRDEE